MNADPEHWPALEMVPWRYDRFFGAGGLCDRYERNGNHLVQFCEIANWLTARVPGLTRDAVTVSFLSAVKNDWFGRHGARGTIKQLIDLDCGSAPPGKYSLRPSGLRVQQCPELMRARRSVWTEWLMAEEWSVPQWLKRSVGIEGEAVVLPTEPPALPHPRRPATPGPRPHKRDRAVAAMRDALKIGKYTPETLRDEKQEALATEFNVRRGVATKARKIVLSEFGGN